MSGRARAEAIKGWHMSNDARRRGRVGLTHRAANTIRDYRKEKRAYKENGRRAGDWQIRGGAGKQG